MVFFGNENIFILGGVIFKGVIKGYILFIESCKSSPTVFIRNGLSSSRYHNLKSFTISIYYWHFLYFIMWCLCYLDMLILNVCHLKSSRHMGSSAVLCLLLWCQWRLRWFCSSLTSVVFIRGLVYRFSNYRATIVTA